MLKKEAACEQWDFRKVKHSRQTRRGKDNLLKVWLRHATHEMCLMQQKIFFFHILTDHMRVLDP